MGRQNVFNSLDEFERKYFPSPNLFSLASKICREIDINLLNDCEVEKNNGDNVKGLIRFPSISNINQIENIVKHFYSLRGFSADTFKRGDVEIPFYYATNMTNIPNKKIGDICFMKINKGKKNYNVFISLCEEGNISVL